ncbi:RNA-binding protein S1 [Oceanobacillus piezotolerans]|uniref:RNA-binding protein S1 n=1 Tax=Oceanobacillus piezotolerans TaxID=2448030 RepID=A0A498D2C6_9BACI|nr:S1 domain-containing RNA-binding protein [Oceanobacillus piezotolerans]RLL41673.1 RNA-binding protein S1 [Oceanobacillus piezotolerans]
MSIEVGSKLQGKVTGITNFGAFVELEKGKTGLVHISEVAENYVKDINDHLKVGDEVEVKVINVEKDGKIGLSIKKAKANANPRPVRQVRQKNPKERQENFEAKMNRFLKDSEDRLASLKKHTESKRGGRGARRG